VKSRRREAPGKEAIRRTFAFAAETCREPAERLYASIGVSRVPRSLATDISHGTKLSAFLMEFGAHYLCSTDYHIPSCSCAALPAQMDDVRWMIRCRPLGLWLEN